jgi:hypothetical protein
MSLRRSGSRISLTCCIGGSLHPLVSYVHYIGRRCSTHSLLYKGRSHKLIILRTDIVHLEGNLFFLGLLELQLDNGRNGWIGLGWPHSWLTCLLRGKLLRWCIIKGVPSGSSLLNRRSSSIRIQLIFALVGVQFKQLSMDGRHHLALTSIDTWRSIPIRLSILSHMIYLLVSGATTSPFSTRFTRGQLGYLASRISPVLYLLSRFIWYFRSRWGQRSYCRQGCDLLYMLIKSTTNWRVLLQSAGGVISRERLRGIHLYCLPGLTLYRWFRNA